MANYFKREEVDALAATATFLEDVDHSDYEGYLGAKRARATSPYGKGSIVLAQLGYTGKDAPKRVLVYGLDLTYSPRIDEWVDHVSGFVERKDGTFGTMMRRICRGDITRGYADKALRA